MVNTEQPQTKAALKNQGAVAKIKETKAPKGVPSKEIKEGKK